MMALLGDILGAARRSSDGFERWLAAREPGLAADLAAAAAAEGMGVATFLRVAVADFARFAPEEDWAQLSSRLRGSADPGMACLLSMVGWRLAQVRAHRSHATQGTPP